MYKIGTDSLCKLKREEERERERERIRESELVCKPIGLMNIYIQSSIPD